MPEGETRQQREKRLFRLRLLWENRGFLIRVFVWSLLVSGLIVLVIPNSYEAVERLMPPDGQQGMGMAILSALSGRGTSLGSGAGAMAGDLLGMKNSGALFVGILGSRTVQDRLIEDFNLKKVYHESKIEDTRKALARHTTVTEDRKSGIISIAVTDHDAHRATAMAQAYVTELDRLVAQVSTSSARRERVFLEGRLTAVKQELDGAAHKFSDFASKNAAIDIPAQGKAMVEAAAVLQGQLIAAQSELSGLQAIYTDQNVRVKAMRARVAQLRAQLVKLGGEAKTDEPGDAPTGSPRNLNTSTSNADPPAADPEKPEKKDASIYPTIRQLPVLGVTYFNLYRQTKIEETVYELLTQQYELAKVQEAKEIPSVKVLDSAVVPTKKSFPPRILLMVLGAVLGVIAGAMWLFTKRRWTAIDPQDPGKRLALEVFAGLREDTKDLTPATAFSFLMSGRKEGREEESRSKERAGGNEGATEKSFTRAAGRGMD